MSSYENSSSHPYSQLWSTSSQRRWSERDGRPVADNIGSADWDDMKSQLALMYDLCHKRHDSTQLNSSSEANNKFEIRLDVSHYSPEEFAVKIVDKHIVIECKHEEKKDDYGWVSRQFNRRFSLPEDVDIEKVRSTLSSTGILTVEVPKKVFFQTKEENVVFIPIIHQKDSEDKCETNCDQKSDPKTEKNEISIEVK